MSPLTAPRRAIRMLHKFAGDDSPSCVAPSRGCAPGRGRRLQFHHRPHPVGPGPAAGRGGRRRDPDRPGVDHAGHGRHPALPSAQDGVGIGPAGRDAGGGTLGARRRSFADNRKSRSPSDAGEDGDHRPSRRSCAGRRMCGSLPYVIMIGSDRRTTVDVLEDVDDDVRLPGSGVSFRRFAHGRRPAF